MPNREEVIDELFKNDDTTITFEVSLKIASLLNEYCKNIIDI